MADSNKQNAVQQNVQPVVPAQNAPAPAKAGGKSRPPKTKQSGFPAPTPGKYAVKITAQLASTHSEVNYNVKTQGLFDMANELHQIGASFYKDIGTQPDAEHVFDFLGRLALAKQFAKEARDFEGDSRPDIATVSEYAEEIPAPIQIAVAQIGMVEHDGVVHRPEDADIRAMKELLLAATQKGELEPYEKKALDLIGVDFVKREFNLDSASTDAFASVVGHKQALETCIRELEPKPVSFKLLNGQDIHVYAKPRPEDFAYENTLELFYAKNGEYLRQFGVDDVAFTDRYKRLSIVSRDVLNGLDQARLLLGRVRNNEMEKSVDRVSFEQVYAAVAKYRKTTVTRYLTKLKSKIKMLNISALNGKGTLAQFINVKKDERLPAYSPYQASSDEITYGLLLHYNARFKNDDIYMDRYQWAFREDLVHARTDWLKSFIVKPK
jgi:hypothetical protein